MENLNTMTKTVQKTVQKVLNGIKFNYRPMLGKENAKTSKGVKYGYLTGILYLAPSDYAKKLGYNVKNVCSFASMECKEGCLFFAGRGKFKSVIKGRVEKTLHLLENANINLPNIDGIYSIIKDINTLLVTAKNKGLIPCIRLNGTSDLPIHKYGIIEEFKNVQFYDYTKDSKKMLDYCLGLLPKNYHLTFSYTGEIENVKNCIEVLKNGENIAVVFKNGLPSTFLGYKVIDGDKHDLTFLHGKNVVVGLKAKGKVENGLFLVDSKKL